MSQCSLMRFAENVYSQNGEDGVLREVFRRLGIERGTFVEFGAGNGRDLSNTLRLAEEGWSGVWIEADSASFEKASALAATFSGRVQALCTIVGFEGDRRLDKILARTRVPKTLDFMSIDIDSHDLEVWRATEQYRARVVLIEINSSVPVGTRQVHGMPLDDFIDGGYVGRRAEGASFTSMLEVGQKKGYTLVCHTGNLLFVDSQEAGKLNLPLSEIVSPASIFDDKWVRWSRRG